MITGYFSQKQADFCGTAKYWNKDKTAVLIVSEVDTKCDGSYQSNWDDQICLGEIYTDESGKYGGFISSDIRSGNNMKIIDEPKPMNPFSGEGKRRMDLAKKSRYM